MPTCIIIFHDNITKILKTKSCKNDILLWNQQAFYIKISKKSISCMGITSWVFSYTAPQQWIVLLKCFLTSFHTSLAALFFTSYNQVQAICLPRVTSIIRLPLILLHCRWLLWCASIWAACTGQVCEIDGNLYSMWYKDADAWPTNV